jgi:PKD repeat protein
MDRTSDNVSDFRIFHARIGALSDDHPFALSELFGKRKELKTVLFLKDLGWIEHHRDGMNHTKGDAIDLYSSDEVNLTAEMIWNVSRYFSVNPNTWFTDIDTELWDSPDDNNKAPDHLNVSYTIRTCIPEDRVVVKAILYNNLWYKPEWEKYIISSNDDVTHFINFTLPALVPFGYYNLYVYLFNSTGEVDNYNFCLFKNIHHPERDELFANDSYHEIDVYLGGCNDMSNPANQPSSSSQNINAGTSYTFSTSSTDPNSDQIYYQFDWGANSQENDYSQWYGPYNSGASCEIPHTWTTTGEKQVRVRSRDKWFSPNGWSNWSNPLNITVDPGCVISIDRDTVLVNQQLDITGINYGFANVNWNWSYGNGNTSTDQENTHQIYDTVGSYTINLTLNNDSSNVSYETVVNVVNISSFYTANAEFVRLNENIYFTDLSAGLNPVTNWTWDFSDGNISYEQNPLHAYAADGLYNVTLNVTDGGNISNYKRVICVDSVSPFPVTAFYSTEISPGRTVPSSVYVPPVGYGSNITINADFFDYSSGIDSAKFNVTYPTGDGGNFTMVQNSSNQYDYEYIFDDIWQIGDYIYSTWTEDKANNINQSINYLFSVEHLFGYTHQGSMNQSVEDRISGSVFKMNANGTADSVSAFIQTNLSTPPKTKCILYRANDSKLIGTTEEKTPNTGDYPGWVVFNFTGTKPNLINNTEYILSCWSNDTCYLYYDNTTDVKGWYRNLTYTSSSPDPANWTDNESRMYSIYCDYTAVPKILEVSHSPNTTIGLGSDIVPSVLLDGFGNDFESVYMNITYPDDTFWNFSLEDVGNDTFENIFLDNWIVGQYNYSIWAVDKFGTVCNSTGYSYNVSANATISICTLKDEYSSDEDINLTDPPGSSHKIGYELLDDGDVLHIWNRFDSYYFNTSSGIQLTNHYDEYWSHNVLMLGYYNNDQWNLIYRTDELSGFNKKIETDNDTYINTTLWKDLTYKGYDFRLAIRYYLGADDNELTVIPYIKNIDNEDIPYNLGFGWEMKDIQINMTSEGDYISINNTIYYLNETLDMSYTDLPESEFYLLENITNSSTKSLYLKWDNSLNYKLRVKSRDGQYNAPVTLFVRIGTLDSNQEKYTKMYWYDASEVTYYFNSYDNIVKWSSNPGYMVDNITSNYASTTTNQDLELCTGNTCPGKDLGTISKVEIRCYGKYSGAGTIGPDIILRPSWPGDPHIFTPATTGAWSSWFDITDDTGAPDPWTWNDVNTLDVDVEAVIPGLFTVYCSKVELRISYSLNNPPGISNPYPPDSSTGIAISPVLNITVSDPEGDNMTLTWLSNSSGSWHVFGTNTSVSNGTYHQTMSNASENAKWWYWKVNVSDGTDYNESNVYKFFTGYQSKIENKGSTNITGFLSIQIHYYNENSQNWTLVYEPVNDTGGLTIDPGEEIGLDNYFNGRINTTCLADIGNGTYRVYVAFRDIIYVPLVMDDDTELIATYEFTVTF